MAVDSGEFADFTIERAMDAEKVETFSERNGKLVELVRDDQGEFVRRKYFTDAVTEVERVGISFSDAWKAFSQMFEYAGLELVDSTLIEGTPSDQPKVIVARYLGEIGIEADPKSLPKDKKTRLAGNIGNLLTSHPHFLPDSQAFLPDAFAIDPVTEKIVLVDIDPYLKQRRFGRFETMQTEAAQGAFMRRIGWNIDEWAINDDERAAMATAFCITAGAVLEDDSSMNLVNDFGYVHFMSNGMNPQQLEQLGY